MLAEVQRHAELAQIEEYEEAGHDYEDAALQMHERPSDIRMQNPNQLPEHQTWTTNAEDDEVADEADEDYSEGNFMSTSGGANGSADFGKAYKNLVQQMLN